MSVITKDKIKAYFIEKIEYLLYFNKPEQVLYSNGKIGFGKILHLVLVSLKTETEHRISLVVQCERILEIKGRSRKWVSCLSLKQGTEGKRSW